PLDLSGAGGKRTGAILSATQAIPRTGLGTFTTGWPLSSFLLPRTGPRDGACRADREKARMTGEGGSHDRTDRTAAAGRGRRFGTAPADRPEDQPAICPHPGRSLRADPDPAGAGCQRWGDPSTPSPSGRRGPAAGRTRTALP